MVQAIRDQWLIAVAVIVVAVIAGWLLVDRWKSGTGKRGQ
jgi:hypothetical protein